MSSNNFRVSALNGSALRVYTYLIILIQFYQIIRRLKMFLQRSFSSSELLTEGAGIAITMTAAPAVRDIEVFAKSSSRERVILPSVINGDDGGADDKERKYCGFHLTRSKWDPYPWVGFVEPGSIAHVAGLRYVKYSKIFIKNLMMPNDND